MCIRDSAPGAELFGPQVYRVRAQAHRWDQAVGAARRGQDFYVSHARLFLRLVLFQEAEHFFIRLIVHRDGFAVHARLGRDRICLLYTSKIRKPFPNLSYLYGQRIVGGFLGNLDIMGMALF